MREFNIFNTDRQLSALQTAVTMLRPLPEQKSLIYFASGLRLNGVDNQAQLRATINAAIRANVVDPPDRCARPGGAGAARRRDAAVAGRHRHVHRPAGEAAVTELPAVAGHALRAGEGHRRQGAVRLQRSVAGHRAGGGVADAATTCIGYYSTHPATDGTLPPRPRVAGNGGLPASSPYRQGYFARQGRSRSSPPRTRSASSKTR